MKFTSLLAFLSSLCLASAALAHDGYGYDPQKDPFHVDVSQGQGQTATSTSSANSSADNTGGNSSNSVAVDNQAQKRNPVSSAASVLLTTSDDTCMGSIGGGLQFIPFGGSLASTYTDQECVNRKNAKLLHDLGYFSAAVSLLCQNSNVAKAMQAGGTPCNITDMYTVKNARIAQQVPETASADAPVTIINEVETGSTPQTCAPAEAKKPHHYGSKSPCKKG